MSTSGRVLSGRHRAGRVAAAFALSSVLPWLGACQGPAVQSGSGAADQRGVETVAGDVVEPAGDHGAARILFDGRELGDFEPTVFGGEGQVEVSEGTLLLGMGQPMTGVTWQGDELPGDGYELELVARRVAGTDFFCGLTVPVGEAHGSLILGGWGGAVTGFSCLDGADASTNETTKYIYYETGQDYRVRLRVDPGATRLRAWVDDDLVVDVDLEGKLVDIRPEVYPSLPLGIASFTTEARIGPIRWRRITAD